MDTENKFYTYAYLDTRKPGDYIYFDDKLRTEFKFDYQPFYIGKGRDDRMNVHLYETLETTCNTHKVGKINHIIEQTGNKPKIIFMKENLFEKEAFSLEIKLIATIGRSDLKKGPLTNQTDGGDGTSGYIVSEKQKDNLKKINSGKNHPQFGKEKSVETKQKISASKKGKSLKDILIKKYGETIGLNKLNEMTSVRNVPVLQYSLDGIFLMEHVSMSKAAAYIDTTPSSIINCVSGRQATASGFLWKIKSSDDFQKHIAPFISRKIKVLQYSLDGKFLKLWNSIYDATTIYDKTDKSYQSLHSLINLNCKKKTNQALGYIWRYCKKNEPIPLKIDVHFKTSKKSVVQYDLYLNEINRFESTMHAFRETKIDSSSISKVCRGQLAQSGGFFWSYADEPINRKQPAQYLRNYENNKLSVIQYDLCGNELGKFNSIIEASLKTDVWSTAIGAVCKNKRKTAGGFIWKYA